MPFEFGDENVSSAGAWQAPRNAQLMNSDGTSYHGPSSRQISSFLAHELDRVASMSHASGRILGAIEGMYPVINVQKIQFFKPNEAIIFGAKGAIVMITMKDGSEWKSQPSIFLNVISPLGYQKPAEFYHPKYELQDDLDVTTNSTLYWLPTQKVTENALELALPSAVPTKLVIEGQAPDGSLIRFDHRPN